MEKPKIADYEFTDGCLEWSAGRPCGTCESERQRYYSDLELWEAHQAEQANQADNFWMVGGGGAAPRTQHNTYDLAHNEAKRLAEKHPGTAFYVVRPITKVFAEPPKAVSTAITLWTTP